MTKVQFSRVALILTATVFTASAACATPRFAIPDRAGWSPVTLAAEGEDQTAAPRHHNRFDFHSQQQMHTGGGGNSK